MAIDQRLRLPAYQNIYLTLRDWIYSGSLQARSPLPSEAEMSTVFKVSRVTIRKALELLIEEQLVVREVGRGTFVSDEFDGPPTYDMATLLRQTKHLMRSSDISGFETGTCPANEETRLDLNLAAMSTVTFAHMVRTVDDEPLSFVEIFLPSDLQIEISNEDLHHRLVLEILEDKGIHLSSADELIGATSATPQLAQDLNTEIGSAILQTRLVALDTRHRPVARVVTKTRADRYQHHVHIVRQPKAVPSLADGVSPQANGADKQEAEQPDQLPGLESLL